jgi:hypothetical protein
MYGIFPFFTTFYGNNLFQFYCNTPHVVVERHLQICCLAPLPPSPHHKNPNRHFYLKKSSEIIQLSSFLRTYYNSILKSADFHCAYAKTTASYRINLSLKVYFFSAKYEMLNQQHGDTQQKRIEAKMKKKKLRPVFLQSVQQVCLIQIS